jgi:hypothetical protein
VNSLPESGGDRLLARRRSGQSLLSAALFLKFQKTKNTPAIGSRDINGSQPLRPNVVHAAITAL